MGEHPFYRFYRHVTFPLERKLYHRMPRHPSFKHEYWDGALHWTPRPHTCEASLDLGAWRPPPADERMTALSSDIRVRRLAESDWAFLPRVFCSAFAAWPPLSQWDGPAPRRASRCLMEWTRRGRDGPLIAEACVVAHSSEGGEEEAESLVGAALITQQRPAWRFRGNAEPEEPSLPHLTWIFVSNWEQRHGVATRLLGAIVEELRKLGHGTLASTVLTASESSMLWHWGRGFRLERAW
jgi:hypothetical protein